MEVDRFWYTDTEICDCLRQIIVDGRPPWPVYWADVPMCHPIDLAEKWPPGIDGKWYFYTIVNLDFDSDPTLCPFPKRWTRKQGDQTKRIFDQEGERQVGCTSTYQLIHETNYRRMEWFVQFYTIGDPYGTDQTRSPVVLCKLYNDTLPTDEQIIDRLIRTIYTRKRPTISCINMDFEFDYKPQTLVEKYEPARDNKWYILSRFPLCANLDASRNSQGWRIIVDDTGKKWELIYNLNQTELVGCKSTFEFLDENCHKTNWLMELYCARDDREIPEGVSMTSICKIHMDHNLRVEVEDAGEVIDASPT